VKLSLVLLAVATAGLLHNAPATIMPTRRPAFEPGHDLNDDRDLGEKSRRRAARKAHLKAHLKAAGQRAMAKE
jgi:hypothetical protein